MLTKVHDLSTENKKCGNILKKTKINEKIPHVYGLGELISLKSNSLQVDVQI